MNKNVATWRKKYKAKLLSFRNNSELTEKNNQSINIINPKEKSLLKEKFFGKLHKLDKSINYADSLEILKKLTPCDDIGDNNPYFFFSNKKSRKTDEKKDNSESKLRDPNEKKEKSKDFSFKLPLDQIFKNNMNNSNIINMPFNEENSYFLNDHSARSLKEKHNKKKRNQESSYFLPSINNSRMHSKSPRGISLQESHNQSNDSICPLIINRLTTNHNI